MQAHPLGLRAAAREIAAGRLTSEAYTRAALAAIERGDGNIRAWAWLDPARAIDLAKACDARGNAKSAPLAGLPIAVKDIIATAGIPTEMGSAVYGGHVPSESAAVVSKLENAGGFVLGKTVTTEFAFRTPGKTTNPWNAGHTPGGSSSGSAAAVAAGFVPVALGTQTLGSIIRPAAFCGVVGFKPSYGLISRTGVYPFAQSLDTVGVFARCVEDAGFLASQLLGLDERDNGSIRALSAKDFEVQPCSRLPRLAIAKTPVWDMAQDAQKNALMEPAQKLRTAGAEVVEIELPAAFGEAQNCIQTIMRFEAARVFQQVKAKAPTLVSAAIDEVLETGFRFSDTEYARALATRDQLRADLAQSLKPFDAILTPPSTGEAPAGLDYTGDPVFCTTWSLCGVPAITIPVGFGPAGLPLGLQIVGPYLGDGPLLSVAAWCERHLPFPYEKAFR